MIRNYFKVAFRSLSRNSTFTLVNVLGLVIGISFSCMLYIYVSNELSYDTFHSKSDRTYRIITNDLRDPNNPRQYGVTSPQVGKALLEDFPEVEEMVRLHQYSGQVVFEVNGEKFQERNWFTADSNFFNVFDFEFVAGDKSKALSKPYSLVITESTKVKYFGNENPIGKVLEIDEAPVTITGVIKDQPDNSHLQFEFLFSDIRNDDNWKAYMNSWDRFGAYTYIVLSPNSSIDDLKTKMPALLQKNLGSYAGLFSMDFQPLEDIYLHSGNIESGTEKEHGQMSYIYIFSSMGIFLLIIACINYINLSTSKALARSKEVGVRKVVGAHKSQLILQFLTESFIVTFISMFLAIGVMDLLFPYFNMITGKSFDVSLSTLKYYSLPLIVITLVVGLISGGYPAFYMAKLRPVSSLKAKNQGEGGAMRLRKGLVVFQFALTVVMIFSTIVIGRQLNFIQNKDIGFDDEKLVVIDINSGNVRRNFQTLKEEYAKVPGVQSVAVSSRVPGEWKSISEAYVKSPESSAAGIDSVRTYFMGFDEDMLTTYGLTMKSGRFFQANGLVDSTTVLLNESAVQALGLTDPVGSSLHLENDGEQFDMTVIGVLKDFNFQSLHQKVAPIVIGSWNNPVQSIDYFSLKVTGDVKKAIQGATKVHNMFDEYSPIEYHFLDQQLNLFYKAEERAGMIFKMGGGLSVLVACLGLFGLATYNIERRTKELGIRKVLGASSINIFMLLSSAFTKQVGVAFIIASPIAYYLMKEWLNGFAYKISLDVWIFLASGLAAFTIALATVSYRSIKAAHSNPLDALKQE
ncbi:MAG: ABC transporter permease [Cyclobacteriaceae bacterium]|nr:ABC transporter permease [Cyclobacteriaceae bacterium]